MYSLQVVVVLLVAWPATAQGGDDLPLGSFAESMIQADEKVQLAKAIDAYSGDPWTLADELVARSASSIALALADRKRLPELRSAIERAPRDGDLVSRRAVATAVTSESQTKPRSPSRSSTQSNAVTDRSSRRESSSNVLWP